MANRCLLLALGASLVAAAQASKPPNLLVILTDQQRFDAIRRVQEELNVPEKARIHTPNIDRLIDEGAYFRSAYTHCPVCGPARTSLLTGHTIENTGVRTNTVSREDNMYIPGNDAGSKIPSLRSYDDILVHDKGFVAEYYGKWHSPESIGYCYSNDVRGTRIQSWMGKYESDNTTKRYVTGLGKFYRDWLEENYHPEREAIEGEQINTYSRRPYLPDPLDARYGMSPSDMKVQQSDQHGQNTLPDDFSITAQRGMEILDVLDRLHDSGEQWSLHVSFHSPHPPMIATPKYHSMYNPDDLVVPASIYDDVTNSAYSARHEKYEKLGYADANLVRRMTATYYGLITEIDLWMGRIFDKLEDLDLANNTLIAFSSDHGDMLGSHGMRSKNVFYEEAAHVPLILRFPDMIKAGTVVDKPVSHLDLHSTFLDYLGAHGDYKSDGRSLRKYIEGTDDEDDFTVIAWNYTDASRQNRPTKDPAFMIRKGSWKLMVAGEASLPTLDMLYDLCTDPSEMNNLIGLEGETAADAVIGKAEHLKALLVRYLEEANHPATDEIRRRRQWRSSIFWVGDTAIKFRALLPSGIRTEYLYIGNTATDVDVDVASIRIEGDLADRFSTDWNSLDSIIRGMEHRVISITYTDPGLGYQESMPDSARLVIKSTVGEDKVVTLLRPGAPEDSNPCVAATETIPENKVTSIAPDCVGDRLLPGRKLLQGKFLCHDNWRFGFSAEGDLGFWVDDVMVWNINIVNGATLFMRHGGYLVVRGGNGAKLWTSQGDSKTRKIMPHVQSSIFTINGIEGPRLVSPDGRTTWIMNPRRARTHRQRNKEEEAIIP